MNRREFLRLSLCAGVPPLFGEYDFLKGSRDYASIRPVRSQKHARVVSFRDGRCVSRNFTIDAGRAAALFRRGLLEYTGKRTIREAVRGLFPKFREDARVSIKVNTASWELPTHRVIAESIASCLVEAGVKPDGILIWERSEETLKGGGFAPTRAPGAVKVVATDTPGYGYDESRIETVRGVSVPLTSILTRHSDYLINLSVLKHHFIAGVTGALKNLYGCIPLLDRPFLIGPYGLLKFHLNNGDPCIGELNDIIARRVPTILYVCDALLGSYEKGPWGPPQWVQNEILLSHDPVALDTISLYRIEKRRRDAGLSPVMGNAKHVRTAALMGLGTNNVENIDFTLKSVG
jgi:uncharacterized protein (DUF362 family)